MKRLLSPAIQPIRATRNINRTDAGAVLVETSICVLFVAIILSGILDYGALFGSTIDVAAAARDAARAGTSTDTAPIDDNAIVASLLYRPSTPSKLIQKVVIYKAQDGISGPPQACIDSVTSSEPCDIYTQADMSGGPNALVRRPGAQGWTVDQRKAGTDYLGVWLSVTNNRALTLIWAPHLFSDHFAMKLDASGGAEQLNSPNANSWTNDTTTNPTPDPSWICFEGRCDTPRRGFPGTKGGVSST